MAYTKEQWQLAERMVQESNRERLGEIPSDEEWFAFYEGRLAGDDEDRMREFACAYPELAACFTTPWPEISPEDERWFAEVMRAVQRGDLPRPDFAAMCKEKRS